jgi:hypothetical protein
MATLFLDFEYESELRTCRILKSVLDTSWEDEYLIAEVEPPLPGKYLDHRGEITQVILVPYRGAVAGTGAKLLSRYLHQEAGFQELLGALKRGDVPRALSKVGIPVVCVVSPEPVLGKTVDHRSPLKKIGLGDIHTDPDVLRPKRKRPGFWLFLWWRIRDALEDWGLLPWRRR